jgi:protein TonB
MPEVTATQAPEPQAARPPQPEAVTARDVTAPPVPQPRPEVPRREIAKPAPPSPAPELVQAAEAPSSSGAVSAAAETRGRTASQSAGGQPAPAAIAGASSQAAVPGGAADYMSVLRAWLEQHKEYPSRARRRRVEGTALLVFVMDRGGRVLSHRIERSAGDPSLDHAVAEMIERAQPLPPMPDSFQQARLEVRVPVQFLLR